MTPFIAKLILVIGAVSWFVIRLPHQRRSWKTADPNNQRTTREKLLLTCSFTGLGIIPLIYMWHSGSRASPIIRSSRSWPGLALLVFASVALAVLSGAPGTRPQLVRFAGGPRAAHARYRWPVPLCPPPHVFGVLHVGAGAGAVVAELVRGTGRAGRIRDIVFLRVGREEAMMLESFGEQYRAYMARTARLIPHIY